MIKFLNYLMAISFTVGVGMISIRTFLFVFSLSKVFGVGALLVMLALIIQEYLKLRLNRY